MMLVMRFLMSLGCWWCFCNFTGKPPPHPPIFWFKSKPWVGWVRRSPWTCRARRGCHLWDPESLQSTAPWCVEKMTRGFPGGCRPGRWLRWGTKKAFWEWDLHLLWDTGWVCEVTSNSNTNNSSTNNSNINEQTPLWCKVFIVSQSKDMPEANSSLLKSPLCCNRCCCWGLGSGNFLVTCLFVPEYSILLPKCISELLSAAGALINSPDEL